MDSYLLIKALHILSATVLFGTGLGIAFFYWSARHSDDASRLFAARTTVRADFLFTLPAVILQPATGGWLVLIGSFDPTELWLVISYVLFGVAGLCWLPVVWLQIRMRDMLQAKSTGAEFDDEHFERLRKAWFWLGWPAFVSLVLVFCAMVTKPSW